MYKLLLIPLLVIIITQLIKLIIDLRYNSFSWYKLVSYGGMPSSHSSAMTSIVTLIGLHDGIFTTLFVFALVTGLLIIRDALGLRRFVGKHAAYLNTIVEKSDSPEIKHLRTLHERIGHTELQVTIGVLVGFTLTIIMYSAF